MEATIIQDERKMIPVTPETHRRVMAIAGKMQEQRGSRVSMDTVVTAALDIAEPAILQAGSEPANV